MRFSLNLVNEFRIEVNEFSIELYEFGKLHSSLDKLEDFFLKIGGMNSLRNSYFMAFHCQLKKSLHGIEPKHHCVSLQHLGELHSGSFRDVTHCFNNSAHTLKRCKFD